MPPGPAEGYFRELAKLPPEAGEAEWDALGKKWGNIVVGPPLRPADSYGDRRDGTGVGFDWMSALGTTSYTGGMPREKTVKITVSIPVSLFDGADRLARRRGVPRSRLYAEALQHYVDEDSESEVTRQLDELAAEIDTSMDPVVKELQRRALARHGG